MLYGLDFINCDLNYIKRISEESVREDGSSYQKTIWRCPYYSRWTSMLTRCFSKKYKTKHGAYKDVTCCEEWLTFSNFKRWMEQQDWENKQLDKDLLVYQNKVYSPETCCFIPQSLNKFMTKNNVCRGELPIGVDYLKDRKTYRSQCRDGLGNSSRTLGYFLTPHEAHREWQKFKYKLAISYINSVEDPLIKQGLLRVAAKIKFDYDNSLITEDF